MNRTCRHIPEAAQPKLRHAAVPPAVVQPPNNSLNVPNVLLVAPVVSVAAVHAQIVPSKLIELAPLVAFPATSFENNGKTVDAANAASASTTPNTSIANHAKPTILNRRISLTPSLINNYPNKPPSL